MMHLLFSFALAITAQVTVPPSPPASQSPYLVGPSDELGVRVFEKAELTAQFTLRTDLTRKYPIDADGSVTFPYLNRLSVAGLSVQEVEAKIQERLRAGFVREAQVSVEITTYRSRSIYVVGHVSNPGEYQIAGPITLLEVMARAGSPTPLAGPVWTVQRHRDGLALNAVAAPALPGGPLSVELMRFAFEDLKAGRLRDNILMQHGDTIVVPAAERFFVTGFVRKPGSYVMSANLTVKQAIDISGGLMERGSTRGLRILRKVDGKDVEIAVGMDDLVLPNDTIRVRQKLI